MPKEAFFAGLVGLLSPLSADQDQLVELNEANHVQGHCADFDSKAPMFRCLVGPRNVWENSPTSPTPDLFLLQKCTFWVSFCEAYLKYCAIQRDRFRFLEDPPTEYGSMG